MMLAVQEKSFLEALVSWHSEGIILLHRLPGAEDPGRSSGGDEMPRPPQHRAPSSGQDPALSAVDSLLEPEPIPKRRAVEGPDGPVPVCDGDAGLGHGLSGVADSGASGRHDGIMVLRDDTGRLGAGDVGLLGAGDGGRGGILEGGCGSGDEFKACSVAASNLNAHPHPYQITGWSVIRCRHVAPPRPEEHHVAGLCGADMCGRCLVFLIYVGRIRCFGCLLWLPL